MDAISAWCSPLTAWPWRTTGSDEAKSAGGVRAVPVFDAPRHQIQFHRQKREQRVTFRLTRPTLPRARALLAMCLGMASACYDSPALAGLHAGRRPSHAARENTALGLGRIETLTPTAWLTGTWGAPPRYRLSPDHTLGLLQRFANPAVERAPEWRVFWSGRYGPRRTAPAALLRWSALTAPEPAGTSLQSTKAVDTASALRPPVALADAFQGLELAPVCALEAVATPEPHILPVAFAKRCLPWQRSRPVSSTAMARSTTCSAC